MKRVRKLFLFALLFLGFAASIKAMEAAASVGTIGYDYDEEYIKIVGGNPVYYQVVKEGKTQDLSPDKWVAAVKYGSDYYIDFSGTGNSKSIYYALTTDAASTEAEDVAVVEVVVKSIKISLDYSVEEHTDNEIYDIISGLEVKFVDKEREFNSTNRAEIENYYIEWRRSINIAWTDKDDFTQFDWDLLRNSQGTLYARVYGEYDTNAGEEVYFRPSKEVKLKLPKATKAPSVKIDYDKGTFGIKNGMQVRTYEGNTAMAWCNVAQYDNAATAEVIFGAAYNDTTKTKVSKIELDDLVTKLNTTLNDSYKIDLEDVVTIDVRTAATDKKFPSAIRTITFTMPLIKPNVNSSVNVKLVVGDKAQKTESEFEIDFSKILADNSPIYSDYEYVLVTTADAVNLDFSTIKWSKVPGNGVADLSGKVGKTYSYTLTDGTEKSVNYEESGVLFIRRAADKEAQYFASEAAKVTMNVQ